LVGDDGVARIDNQTYPRNVFAAAEHGASDAAMRANCATRSIRQRSQRKRLSPAPTLCARLCLVNAAPQVGEQTASA
jgi:hypothetical protein